MKIMISISKLNAAFYYSCAAAMVQYDLVETVDRKAFAVSKYNKKKLIREVLKEPGFKTAIATEAGRFMAKAAGEFYPRYQSKVLKKAYIELDKLGKQIDLKERIPTMIKLLKKAGFEVVPMAPKKAKKSKKASKNKR